MRVSACVYIYMCVCVCVCDGVYAYRRCIAAAVARNEIIHRRALVIECFAARENEREVRCLSASRESHPFFSFSLCFSRGFELSAWLCAGMMAAREVEDCGDALVGIRSGVREEIYFGMFGVLWCADKFLVLE